MVLLSVYIAHHRGMKTSQACWVTHYWIPAVLLSSISLSSVGSAGPSQVAWEILCAGLSGCHIPRWHVVTAPSGSVCCHKVNWKKKQQQENRPPTKLGSRSKLGPFSQDETSRAQADVPGGPGESSSLRTEDWPRTLTVGDAWGCSEPFRALLVLGRYFGENEE